MLTSVSAFADPPPASPSPPAPPAAISPAPPTFAPAARPPQNDLGWPQIPMYVYVPGSWASSYVPGAQGMPGVPTTRVWYGWQTLFVLAASTTVGLAGMFGGAASNSDAMVIGGSVVGSAGLLLGGPIVHWARGNTAKGFEALGINFGAPVVGAGLGIGIACAAGGCGNNSQGYGVLLGMMFGGGAGLLTAVIVDVSVLSYDKAAPAGPLASRRSPGWTILPDLKISREKTTFGFAGVF